MGLEEVLDSLGKVDEVAAAGPSVLEVLEVAGEGLGVCVEKVVAGGGAHGGECCVDALEDLCDASVGEQGCDESDDFLVEGVGIVVDEFEGVGVDEFLVVELLVEGVEVFVQCFTVHGFRF